MATWRFGITAPIAILLAALACADEPPRKLPVLAEPEPEMSLSGFVKEIKGQLVILSDGQQFSVSEDTKYFQETGSDLTDAKGVSPGDSVMAVGKPGANGEFHAERVIRAKYTVKSSKSPSGPDRMEWATNAVVEGVEKDWILIDKHRKIPIGKQTKLYVTKNGKNELAAMSAIKKGAMIDFNLSGRPAVLKGQEAGDVTTVWVVVWERR